jgi:hypothetical protein
VIAPHLLGARSGIAAFDFPASVQIAAGCRPPLQAELMICDRCRNRLAGITLGWSRRSSGGQA